ncbi:MAG TPA: D-2-hydroxyacid dehydrogenase [Caldilineaceae bacterium]|nr:D-2-hydroxyacid dehydrogenase [Caldilineaceae bacterium]
MLQLVLMPPQSEWTRSWVSRLEAALPDYVIVAPETDEEARTVIGDADAAYGWVPPDLLPLAHKLRWLHSAAIGPPAGYYYPALIEHPLVVTNPRGIYDDHISQHILMVVLALARGLPAYLAAQQQRRWDPDAHPGPALDLATATALIAGVGGIGHETARLCAAFGMRVVGVDARWEHPAPYIEQHGPEALDALLPLADFVIVTLPHTPQTAGMWHARRFQRMKATAYFINVGRGLTTNLDDLVTALEQEVIAGCALDVFAVEPLPTDHKLWTMSNALLTPHIAGKDAVNLPERQFQILLDNARRFANGAPLRNLVDKAAWF